MKSLVNRVVTLLKGKSGESLLEGIVSILIFTVLIASVTMMIVVSLRITGRATEAAVAGQMEANAVLAGDDAAVLSLGGEIIDEVDVVLTINGATGNVINVPVTVYIAESFTAFEPE